MNDFTSEISRYDIVVAYNPIEKDRLILKRIIGLPNERVDIRNGKIYIDEKNKAIKETYLKEKWIKNNNGYSFLIPEDKYLLLGDNRNESIDARNWKGKAMEKRKKQSRAVLFH